MNGAMATPIQARLTRSVPDPAECRVRGLDASHHDLRLLAAVTRRTEIGFPTPVGKATA